MIDVTQQRAERRLDVEEIDDEAGMRIHGPLQLELDPVGMAVQPFASVRLGHVRQPMCRLELERL